MKTHLKMNLGKWGEQEACKYLTQKGYTIIDTNYYYKHKEIDIIASYKNKIIFIEVKCRTDEMLETPSEAVSFRKQRFLVEAADYYIQHHNINCEAQFDVILIIKKNNIPKINHIVDAFYPLIH